MDWELRPEESEPTYVGPFTAYVYGVIIVLAVVIALGEWIYRRRGTGAHARSDRADEFRSYVAVALLWPLFFAAVVFIILWSVLTRRPK